MRRLTITLPELEQGFAFAGGNKARTQELTHLSAARTPMPIYPVLTHDHKKITAVLLTQDAEQGSSKLKLYFRPVWCKLFTICSMKKNTLSAVLCEFEFGKFWFDKTGVHATNGFSTSGHGCDPTWVEASELALGDMLADSKRHNLIKDVLGFIQQNF